MTCKVPQLPHANPSLSQAQPGSARETAGGWQKFRALPLPKTERSRRVCGDSSVGILTGEPDTLLRILYF